MVIFLQQFVFDFEYWTAMMRTDGVFVHSRTGIGLRHACSVQKKRRGKRGVFAGRAVF
ncbi:MAG: hypothetical protein K2Y31_11905 [Burkholderiales bacterium]|jgi:hypothetical protein|nr:hypothetical protein [Burkholderiales bacterium]